LPLTRALLTGEIVNGEDVIIRGVDGKDRWVLGHAAPEYDEEGVLLAGVLTFPEITEQKRTEKELERFRNLAEASPDLVAIIDEHGVLLYLNPAGHALCGLESIEGVAMFDLYTEAGQRVAQETAGPIVRTVGVWQGSSEIRGADGQAVPVAQSITSHRNAQGELTHQATIIQDQRGMRALQEQLSQSQRLESIGRLAGGISHDFNNLLTVILNYATMVQDQIQDQPEACEDLEQIVLASKRAGELCHQLLAVARRQIIRPRALDLGQAIEELSKLFRRTLGEDILLRTEVEESLWTVVMDHTQLTQILMNLIVNARQAMPQGGELLIEGRNMVLDEAFIAQRPEVLPGEYVMLAVSDTGSGMSKEVRDRAFEPFFSTKATTEGTGLGLATVHGAVHQNGGHIWLYSEPGQGTSFKIYFPRDESRAHEASGQRKEMGPGTGTVVVVEDSESLRVLTVRLLRSGGYQVLQACDGPHALRVAEAFDGVIDLLVTDVVMPYMNGRDLASTLVTARPALEVLYVSGYTENTIVHHGVLDDGVDFLAKPFTRLGLLERVAQILARSA
jgi:PAS domain S-box-containing protein